MGNRSLVEDAIKKEMGEDTKVEHTFACPFTVVSEIDGKQGTRECLPMYFNNCHNCGCDCMGGHDQTAKNAAEIAAPAATDEAPGSASA